MTELPKVAAPAQDSSAGAAALAALTKAVGPSWIDRPVEPEGLAELTLERLRDYGWTLVPTAEVVRLRRIETLRERLIVHRRESGRSDINTRSVIRDLTAALAATDVVADTEREDRNAE